jgi:hypothetical protein
MKKIINEEMVLSLANSLLREAYRPSISNILDKLLAYINDALQKDYKYHENQIKKEDQINKYSDYNTYLEGVLSDIPMISNLAYELCILALFKELEINLYNYFENNKAIEKNSKFHLNQHTLTKILNIEKKDLALKINKYDSFLELYYLNNSIKHNGSVSKDLSESFKCYYGEFGDDLINLDESYERLKTGIVEFYYSVVDVFQKKANN